MIRNVGDAMTVAGDLAIRLVELAEVMRGSARVEAVRLAERADRLADDLLGLSIQVDWQKCGKQTIQ